MWFYYLKKVIIFTKKMGACAPDCVKSYIYDQDLYIQGNKIFKKINTNLDSENKNLSPNEKKSLKECIKLLEEAEKSRIEIAKKFKSFLYNTGACVLTQPTLERGLITYIINLLTQIIISANKKKIKFTLNDISLDKFIFITNSLPFVELNKNILVSLKKKYDFDFYKNDCLKNGLNSIIDFLSSIPSIKSVLENQVIVLKNLCLKSITNIDMIDQIGVAIDGIYFLIDFFHEITNGLMETQIALTKPRKIELFYKISMDAADKKFHDPKQIALTYANGDNCGDIEKWEENMTYREFHQLKY